MRHSIGTIAIVLLSALLAAAVSAGGADDEPLVRVNGSLVKRAELDRFMRIFSTGPQEPVAADAMTVMDFEEFEAQRRKEALQRLIDRHLLLQEARKEYVKGDFAERALDAIVERELQKLQRRQGSRLKVVQWLASQGLSLEQFKELQIEELLIGQYTLSKVFSGLSVTPAEMRRYYEEHREEFQVPRTVVYRQIFFPVVDYADQAVQREKAEAVLERIRQGADFGEMADQHSADSEEYPGGLRMVRLSEDQLDWLPPAVAGLAPGQVSAVGVRAGGLSIARLERVVPAHVLPFEDVQGDIGAGLLAQKRAAALDECLQRLRREAKIEHFPAARKLGL